MPGNKSLPTLATELWELVVAYAKQEAWEPITGLGRFIAVGMVGSVLLAIGLVLLVLGGLRALEVETGSHLGGHWSWAPYVVVLVAAVVVLLLASRAIGAKRRRATRKAAAR